MFLIIYLRGKRGQGEVDGEVGGGKRKKRRTSWKEKGGK